MTETMSFEDTIIADMRANDGEVTSGPLTGHPILIMTSRGAKSRAERRALLTYHRDGSDYVVAGTAGGSRVDPSWLHNLAADPDVEIEVRNEKLEATATIVGEPDRDRLWAGHVKALPWFVDYPEQTGRVIPMVRLAPTRRR